jgi:hypothetical protein
MNSFNSKNRSFFLVVSLILFILFSNFSFAQYLIQGNTLDNNANPLPNVVISGFPSAVESNAAGFYSVTVPSGWSGTVTPALAGYNFTPASRTYNNVLANIPGQYYVGTPQPVNVTIAGTVTFATSGAPAAGVTMNGLPGTPITNNLGYYSAVVPVGWSGTVTPALAGYGFIPVSNTYSNVTVSLLSENYSCSVQTFDILGTIVDASGNPIPNVALVGFPSSVVTDNNGNYAATVLPKGWSGTVVPTLTGYIFDPPYRTYSNVTADIFGSNYIAAIALNFSGYVLNNTGNPMMNVVLNGLPGTPVTDANGLFTTIIPSGWSGNVVPAESGYYFTPPNKVFTNVISSVTNCNFTGSPLTGIEDKATLPTSFALNQNYPNPFNPSTTISFDVPVTSKVILNVYDILGNHVATLVNETKEAGRYNVTFDASKYTSGVYIYRIQAGSFVQTKKMILMK